MFNKIHPELKDKVGKMVLAKYSPGWGDSAVMCGVLHHDSENTFYPFHIEGGIARNGEFRAHSKLLITENEALAAEVV